MAPSSVNPEVTREIDIIVRRALEREPEDRYQTAGELAKDLDSVIFSISPTPTSADLAIYMHRLYDNVRSDARPLQAVHHEEDTDDDDDDAQELILPPAHIEEKPPVEDITETMTAATPVAAEQSAGPTFGSVSTNRRSPVFPIAASLILVATLAAGGWAIYKKQSPATPVSAAAKGPAASVAKAPAPGVAPQPPVATTTESAPVTTLNVSPGTVPTNDQPVTENEVNRRLEAERLRQENQRAAQAAAGRPQPAPVNTPRIDIAPPPVTATQLPPPVVESTPLPQPTAAVVVATPTPPPQEVRPTPAPTQVAAVERPVRAGDLVPPGTPGLTQPALIHQFKPPYPPLAKMQRVEGIVVLQALISETGRVLEVKILRGVQANVGINEAAIEAVKRSSFSPATKDGVKVRTYKTMTIPFKL